jgi:hypothetical protein
VISFIRAKLNYLYTMYEQSRKMMQTFVRSTAFLLFSLLYCACFMRRRDQGLHFGQFLSGGSIPDQPRHYRGYDCGRSACPELLEGSGLCFTGNRFQSVFHRYTGWTGGDATYSIPLPDGRTLWLFGDSFIGTVRPDRSRPGSSFYRNAAMVQQGNEFITLPVSGNAFVRPADPGWWYWPGHG